LAWAMLKRVVALPNQGSDQSRWNRQASMVKPNIAQEYAPDDAP
jgi:hypothetical protein